MKRREFLKLGLGAAAMAVLPGTLSAMAQPWKPKVRWRGFNLLNKFVAGSQSAFQEDQFRWMSEWGFNFVRLPMSYQCWSTPKDWSHMDEKILAEIDQAVEFGIKHKIHVNLNMHRIPGYCVNPPDEPFNLWLDKEAQDAAAFQWGAFAKRYRDIPSDQLSFDLINEPGELAEEAYAFVVRLLVKAIRAESPKRLIMADGLAWGTKPVPSLKSLGVGQSTRGYYPMEISHYQAPWIHGSAKFKHPSWPLDLGDRVIDRETIRSTMIQPWKELEKQGVFVHVGEWGCYSKTPHAIALAWMRDDLTLWKQAGFGWAVWNLIGDFGILDSNRTDVQYEDFHGHKLDREMLTLLQKY